MPKRRKSVETKRTLFSLIPYSSILISPGWKLTISYCNIVLISKWYNDSSKGTTERLMASLICYRMLSGSAIHRRESHVWGWLMMVSVLSFTIRKFYFFICLSTPYNRRTIFTVAITNLCLQTCELSCSEESLKVVVIFLAKAFASEKPNENRLISAISA